MKNWKPNVFNCYYLIEFNFDSFKTTYSGDTAASRQKNISEAQ